MYSIGNKNIILDVLLGLEKPQHIVILPHVRTDPDALGCSSGMADFLMQIGHQVSIIVDEEPASNLSVIYQDYPLVVFDAQNMNQIEKPDVFIYLDHHSITRLNQRAALLEHFPDLPLIIIDHHLIEDDSETYFYTKKEFEKREVSAWIESQRSSVSEMISELFLEENLVINDLYFAFKNEIKLTSSAAYGLLSGIYGDTGGLRFSNTSERTFYICSKLKTKQIQIDHIADNLFGQKRLNQLRMIGQIFENASLNQQKNIIWYTVTHSFLNRYQATQDDLEGVCSDMRNIENIDLAILIREISEDEIRVNLRSNENFNCRDLAFVFGGGGHARASGITFRGEVNSADIEKNILFVAEKMFLENSQERVLNHE